MDILGQNTYEIQGEDGRTIRPVHAQQLKRYVSAGKPRDYPDISNQGVARLLPLTDSSAECSAPAGDLVSQGDVQSRAMAKRRSPPRKTALLVRPGRAMAGLSEFSVQRSPKEAQEGQSARRRSLHLSTPDRLARVVPERQRRANCAVQSVSSIITCVCPSSPDPDLHFPGIYCPVTGDGGR